MNIILDYLKSLFDISSDTAATIIITLSVFISSMLFTEIYKTSVRALERLNKRKMIIYFINHLTMDLRKQAKIWEQTVEMVNLYTVKDFSFKRKVIDLSPIDSLGYHEIYNSFFKGFENFGISNKLKIKSFNKFWNTIKAIEFWQDKSYESITYFIEKYNEYNDKRNESLEEFRKLTDQMTLNYAEMLSDNGHAEYVMEINKIKLDWHSMEKNTQPDIVNKHLVQRVLKYNKLNPTIRTLPITDVLLNAEIQYLNIEHLLESYKKQFENYRQINLYNAKFIQATLKYMN
ncbi:MAG: hypothetical protein RLP13_14460 [Cytophagales bacterium]